LSQYRPAGPDDVRHKVPEPWASWPWDVGPLAGELDGTAPAQAGGVYHQLWQAGREVRA